MGSVITPGNKAVAVERWKMPLWLLREPWHHRGVRAQGRQGSVPECGTGDTIALYLAWDLKEASRGCFYVKVEKVLSWKKKTEHLRVFQGCSGENSACYKLWKKAQANLENLSYFFLY